jgi:rSAM/selenodomain-associated transferase 1
VARDNRIVDARPALLLFARAPEPGQVKTRLEPVLTPAESSELYRAFLTDASRLYGRDDRWRRVLCGDPGADDPRLSALFPPPWDRRSQGPGDLGDRLRRAFEDAFTAGAPRAVAVGGDHPTLPIRVLEEVFGVLETADASVVPAEDGGYCAIGLSARGFADVFRGVPWSTNGVLAATLERFREAGLSFRVLSPFYDVDRPEDLERVRRDLAVRDPSDRDFPTATAACLAALAAAPARSVR